MGRLFMELLDCPFRGTATELARHRLGASVAAIVVDFHAEATSENMAFAHSFDGQVSLVVGTHTHCPTADHQILPGGTGFISDVGMCGDYDSVIGMQKDGAAARFWRRVPAERLQPAEGEATVCGVFVETDDATGLRPPHRAHPPGRASRAHAAHGVREPRAGREAWRDIRSSRTSCTARARRMRGAPGNSPS